MIDATTATSDRLVISRDELRSLKPMEYAVARTPAAVMAVDWTNGGARVSITYVNDAFTRTLSYTAAEISRRHPSPSGAVPTSVSAPATVLFDGPCHFCNATVRFVIANDPAAHFRFAPLESAAAAQLVAPYGRDPSASGSIIVIDAAGIHDRSDAVLRIARGLRRPWCWLGLLAIVPAGVRDRIYDFIAANRYRLFGRSATCPLPPPAIRDRFLGDAP